MIPSLLRTVPTSLSEETAEDIFTSTVGTLFTDDYRVSHGDAGSSLIYTSSAYGEIYLTLPDPHEATERSLFAQYVWNAGILLAEIIGGAWKPPLLVPPTRTSDQSSSARSESIENEIVSKQFWTRDWNAAVRGKRVLELGAGSGVLSLVCSFAGAAEVVCTDYPSQAILDPIKINLARNLVLRRMSVPDDNVWDVARLINDQDEAIGLAKVRVAGYKWGCFNDEFSIDGKHAFDLVVAADTLWIGGQHEALLSSFDHFLSRDNATAEGWIVAGFHTGRAKVAGFIDLINEIRAESDYQPNGGSPLVIDSVVEIDTDGIIRHWEEERPGESITERKRWCVFIVVKRR